MKATHKDGRTFEGDDAEFYRTYAPAGFTRVDEPVADDEQAPEAEADDAPADEQPKKAATKTAKAEK